MCVCTRVDTGQVPFVHYSCPNPQINRHGNQGRPIYDVTHKPVFDAKNFGLPSCNKHGKRGATSRTNKALSVPLLCS